MGGKYVAVARSVNNLMLKCFRLVVARNSQRIPLSPQISN